MTSAERPGPAAPDWVKLPTAVLSDALDRLGLPGSAHGLTPLRTGQRMAGPALTVRYVPCGARPGTVGDYLDEAVAGQVIAIDNQGRTGRFMRTGKDRVEVAEVGGVIALGDAQARPADIIVGDDDGVVVIPRERAREVAETAASIAAAESRIRAAALSGERLADARRRHGYHELQRRHA